MAEIKPPKPVKLFTAVFTARIDLFEDIKRTLEKEFGIIDFQSEIFPFENTDYYEKEMGKNLKKIFYFFKNLIAPDKIVDIKIKTIEIEKKFMIQGKRQINIDPGYLGLSKIVLASTKDFSHRIYLGNGIYAEVTLFFKRGTFHIFPYTYPDYRTEGYIKTFIKVREILKNQIEFDKFGK
jgi:hypothetical protein